MTLWRARTPPGHRTGRRLDLPPPDEIGEDDIDVRVEAASEYRLARFADRRPESSPCGTRGYKNRCAFCGAVYGGIEGIVSGSMPLTFSPGVTGTSMC